MNPVRLVLGLVITITISFPISRSIAQTIDCANPQTTLAMRICTNRELETSDRRLNQVYQQLRAKLSGKQLERLTIAEEAWIRYRDVNCAFAKGQFEGGSFAPVAELSCLTEVTRQRVKELEGYRQER
jgi:uncharacterized protein YecT (DUF1311 family)